jgi:hypothetical protein
MVVSEEVVFNGDGDESDNSCLGGLYLLFSPRNGDRVAIFDLVSSWEFDVDVEVALDLKKMYVGNSGKLELYLLDLLATLADDCSVEDLCDIELDRNLRFKVRNCFTDLSDGGLDTIARSFDRDNSVDFFRFLVSEM